MFLTELLVPGGLNFVTSSKPLGGLSLTSGNSLAIIGLSWNGQIDSNRPPAKWKFATVLSRRLLKPKQLVVEKETECASRFPNAFR